MDIEKHDEQIQEEQPQEQMSLAFEIYQEQKLQNKRLFTALIVVLAMWMATIGVFLYYISLPIDDYVITQDTDTGGNNYNIGGNYNGETENPQNTESSTQ